MRVAIDPEGRRISSSCFRLVSLTLEVQNELEVVKPVLNELEVIRLSSALGLLPSVNPMVFDHGYTPPETFDDDLTRYLRQAVLGKPSTNSNDGMSALGLFGKQAEVTRALKRFGVWSAEMHARLERDDQGIYCVKCPTTADDPKPTLLLFAWIQDFLLSSSRLRDTATYVLRFLACMSSDLQCCLSPEDVKEVEAAVESLAEAGSWTPSFSVGFRVEKQQDQQDGVECQQQAVLRLPNLTNAKNVRLLKGSYPALSVVAPGQRRKDTVSEKLTFPSDEKFAEWAVKQASEFSLSWNLYGNDEGLRDSLLRESGSWPTADLQRAEGVETDAATALSLSVREKAQEATATRQARLDEMKDSLFDLDNLIDKVGPRDEPYRSLSDVLEEMARRPMWAPIDERDKAMLHLPLRLKKQIHRIFALFHQQSTKGGDSFDKVLDTFPFEAVELRVPEKKVSSPSKAAMQQGGGWRSYVSGFFGGNSLADSDVPIVSEFHLRMQSWLPHVQDQWWTVVNKVMEDWVPRAVKNRLAKNKNEFEKKVQERQLQCINMAFTELLNRWRREGEQVLKMSIRPERQRRGLSFIINCQVRKEVWTIASDELRLYKVVCGDDRPNIEDLGFAPLSGSHESARYFTIGASGMLMVTTSAGRTEVTRLDFVRPKQAAWSVRSGGATQNSRSIKTFPKQLLQCDFSAQERLLAFTTADKVLFVYRFSSKFESMECTKRIDLVAQTSLSTVVEVLVADNSLYLLDDSGAIQSINYRSCQTSRKVAISSVPNKTTSGLLLLSEGLALGRFASEGCDDPRKFPGSLQVISSEDFRDIPTTFPSYSSQSRDVSVTCVDSKLFVLDPVAGTVNVFTLALTIRSDSYRIKHSNQKQSAGKSDKPDNKTEHWLRALYHMYEKFPVGGLIDSIGDNSKQLRLRLSTAQPLPHDTAKSCSSFLECVMHDLRKLNKSLGAMDISQHARLVSDDMDHTTDGWKALTTLPTHGFLQTLITFVPVQICRAEGNALTVMGGLNEGGSSPDNGRRVQAADIARSIRFGMLTPLLNAWQGPVVVITSMGKQSTGKSYLLNHLTGSSFAISGARCTDGAWMSIRLLPTGVMLIVLDFEGLGSFERSEQEDVLLSVLNASISMFTIFRMEMRFDKDMDDLFARFQKGVALLKSDPQLFRGMLYMSVKDVNPNDQKSVMDEFVTKLQKLLGANKEHNFLTDLYTGQLEINCSPPLGTLDYYKSLNHARQWIEGELCSGKKKVAFKSGKLFLDCIRLVLAKISILDWTSLDESAQQFLLSEAAEKLPGLLRTGSLIPRDLVTSREPLADITEALVGVDDSFEAVCRAYPAMEEKWVLLKSATCLESLGDGDIDLQLDVSAVTDGDVKEVTRAVDMLLTLFKTLADESNASVFIDRDLQSRFDDFLSFVVRRRCIRISSWARNKFDTRMPKEWKTLEQQQLNRFTALFSRCQSKCAECSLGCMKTALHTGAMDMIHSCGTNHKCERECSFCSGDESVGLAPKCCKEAGHDGVCECHGGDHTCGQPCWLEHSPNCGKRCSAQSGHEGRHHCGVTLHTCGEACSLPNCSGSCISSIEVQHTVHKCVEVACIETCCIDDCSERCSEMDHFHGHSTVSSTFALENQAGVSEKRRIERKTSELETSAPVVHMCNKEHGCPAMCEEDGICRVDVFLKQSSRRFEGARGTFQYTYQEMNGSKKKCSHLLPSRHQTHQGSHSCVSWDHVGETNEEGDATATIHYCDARCPSCNYFCNKEYGHSGLHATAHGNMRNTYFLSDVMDVDVGERQYRAGESGVAEMCNLYCSKMGRAHVHYLECEQDSKDTCVFSGTSNDKRRHCDRELEPKPEHEMDELLHDQFWSTMGWEDPCVSVEERELFNKCAYRCDAPDHSETPSYCVLPAWHAPVTAPENFNPEDGFSYTGGHQFECSHVASNGVNHHVFVLDASGSMEGQPWNELLAAVREYINNCLSSGAVRDIVSIVTFDSYADIVYEARKVAEMTQASVAFRGGGTCFSAGLRLASEVLSRTNFDVYKPVIVFFSDGHPHDPREGKMLGTHLKDTYEKYGLKAYAVGFGSANLRVLERVATCMGGTYHNVLTGTEMKTTFHSISASLSTRAGLALAKQATHGTECSICLKDMSTGSFHKLPNCRHSLHDSCLELLLATATETGRPPLCPICRAEAN